VAIAYSCINAASNTTAKSAGFENQGKLSGSESITLTPAIVPQGATAANYGFTCTTPPDSNTGQPPSVSGAQCSVQINSSSITIVVNPSKTRPGEQAQIAWVTTGMKECFISSPTDLDFTLRNASYPNPNGTAKTPSLTASTDFKLSCTTIGGVKKEATTRVAVE
jgi:hypothetical protein